MGIQPTVRTVDSEGDHFDNITCVGSTTDFRPFSYYGRTRSSAKSYLTTKELLDTLVKTISRNGNLLINVGPSADGTINPIMVDRLLEMGKWLSVNSEGVYDTRSWAKCSEEEEDEHIMYTRSVAGQESDGSDDVLYVFLTEWKNKITLSCPEPTASTKIRMLGLKEGVEEPKVVVVENSPSSSRPMKKASMIIQLPALTPDIIPCQHIWVLAIEGVGNLGPAPLRTHETGGATTTRLRMT
jgi:alpha-L-fucosidase